ncbi:isochorismatase [Sorangium cellulosum]|uniref:Isochorismatase n=1 Tax=Sorangium cellulosum TaxID=56 RepID=A0A2L0EQP4_SORCE|nr:isochorismatase family cysteine hydrolase [Sorangium cellulosum]AUX41631.1 isochorismatase [Sorangium cellulosum]
MTRRNHDLHGAAPDNSRTALLLIDVINDLDFPEGDRLLAHALPMAHRICALKQRCVDAGIPAVYVNDNFGRWQSNFHRQIEHCLEDGVRGREIALLLKPGEQDYFVLKPKHSGFYGTTLEILLESLGVQRLILTGMAGNICVLFTANDAYMRDYRLIIPSDCVASESEEDNGYALRQMQRFLKADIRPSTEIDLEQLPA